MFMWPVGPLELCLSARALTQLRSSWEGLEVSGLACLRDSEVWAPVLEAVYHAVDMALY